MKSLTLTGDGQWPIHIHNLRDYPACRGTTKQLSLRLATTDGVADVRRIELRGESQGFANWAIWSATTLFAHSSAKSFSSALA